MAMGANDLNSCNVLFAKTLAEFGDRSAIISAAGDHLSYAALARRADDFAETLGPRRRLVMIEAANELAPLIAYIGALRHGHPVLMVQAGHVNNASLVEAYRPSAVFLKSSGAWELTLFPENENQLHPDLALLLSTSGSTGTRKFVRLSHEAINENAKSIAQYLAIGADDRPMVNLPIHYSYGHSILSSNLASGACLLLTDASVIDPRFWTFFQSHRATALAGVPYTFDLLERVGFRDMDLPSLGCLTQAGGRLSIELASLYAEWARARGAKFYLMYGQTEATARMAYLPPELAVDHPDAIGRPIGGGRFELIDADGATVEASGVEGELIYTGPNVMMGYCEQRSDLARGHETPALKTGDLALRNDLGLYRITGRLSRIIKPFGVRIALDEVENILSAQGYKVIATGDDRLLALAVLGAAATDTAEFEVRRIVEARLGLPAAAVDVAAIDEAPLLSNGKVDYISILDAARARSKDRPTEPGKTGVARAFEHAFPGIVVGSRDTFVSLGGDSLSYVALSLELENEIARLPAHWETQSVGALEQVAAGGTVKRKRWWSLVGLESETFIRALAIMAVVANHADLAPIAGGANALLILAGLSLARNNFDRLVDGRGLSIVWPFVRRFILPYYVIMLAFLVYTGRFDITSIFLVGNWSGRLEYLNSYWFLEFLLQTYLMIGLMFKIPFIRQRAKRDPWSFGLAALGFSLLARMGVYAVIHHYTNYMEDRTQDALLYLVALGWLVRFADSTPRKILLTILAVGLGALDWTGFFGVWAQDEYPRTITHAALIILTSFMIIWIKSINMPKFIRNAFGVVASSSYYIYISLAITLHLTLHRSSYTPIEGFIVGILVGVLVWLAFLWSERSGFPPAGRRIFQRQKTMAVSR